MHTQSPRHHHPLLLGLQHLHSRTHSRSRHPGPPQYRSPTPSHLLPCRRRRLHSTVRRRATARVTARTPLTTSSCGNTRTGNGEIDRVTVALESMAGDTPESREIPEIQETRGSPEGPENRGMEVGEGAKALVTIRAKLEGAGIHTRGLHRLLPADQREKNAQGGEGAPPPPRRSLPQLRRSSRVPRISWSRG